MDNDKKGLLKIALFVLAMMYVISPVDLMPGLPVDDIIVLVIQFFIQNRLSQKHGSYPVAETNNTFAEDIIDSHEV